VSAVAANANQAKCLIPFSFSFEPNYPLIDFGIGYTYPVVDKMNDLSVRRGVASNNPLSVDIFVGDRTIVL
jgi:hypothetical protein